MPSISLPYILLDVFTETPLTGNPLAVVLDGDGLEAGVMQRIAAEFNLSETVFVLPPAGPAHTARLRIFTPVRELDFAGHPTIGAALVLALRRLDHAETGLEAMIVLEEGVGAVRCGVAPASARHGTATFDLPLLPEPVGCRAGKEVVAAALGLGPHEVGFENHVVTAYSAGLPVIFVPVADRDSISRATVRHAAFRQAFGAGAAVYPYTRETVLAEASFHARMFAPDLGIAEDPATGSAAAAFAGVVMQFDTPPDGKRSLLIEQGYEVGRPSRIILELDIAGGLLRGARIGGSAVIIGEGALRL